MAITMQDIQDEGFEHALRGYDVGQVDVFLERVANEVDAMNKQIADLESQLKEAKDELAKTRGELAEANAEALASPDELELRSELEVVKERLAAATARAEEAEAKIEPMQERLEEKKSLDNAIAEAFIAAQRSAAQIKEDARIEGDRIYRESEAKAREFIRESLAKKAAIDNEIKALSEYSQKFREQYLDMLERFTAHAKEEFSNLANQGVTDEAVEAELPKIDMRRIRVDEVSGADVEEEDDDEKDELPRLSTQQIPQINIPAILPEEDE